jgi:hypothetical protein
MERDELMTEAELAEYCRVSPRNRAALDAEGNGPARPLGRQQAPLQEVGG